MAKLSCGGKGPCCHVGYAHRHCEHCDEVIATNYWTYLTPTWPYQPYQPYRPYQPYWATIAGQTLLGNQTSGNVANFGMSQLTGQQALLEQLQHLRYLPVNEIAEHACEVK